MCSITPEIRELIVKTRRNGKKVKDIAEMFDASRKTVWNGRVNVFLKKVGLTTEIVQGNLIGFIERLLQMLKK